MTIPTPTTLFPDVDGLMNWYLRPALPGVDIQQLMPPEDLRIFPLVLVRNVGGGRRHTRLLGEAAVAIDAFTLDRRSAYETAESAVQVLEYAAEHQVVAMDGAGREGHIARFIVSSAPVEVRHTDSPAGLYRFSAMVSFLVRP